MSDIFDQIMKKSGDSKPSTSGRPMHEHWYGYKKVHINGKVAATCFNCLKTFPNTAKTRLENHRKNCGTSNIEINQLADTEHERMDEESDNESEMRLFAAQNIDSTVGTASTTSTPNSTFSTSTPSASPLPLELKQSKLKRYMDNISEVESEKIDAIMAEFFYGCNVPFSACESKYFKKFIHALRPSYEIPNRHRLAGILLEKTHDKIVKRNVDLVEKMGKQATLLLDGWQNSSANKHNVVAMLATANDEKVMLESFDTSAVRDTTENIVDLVQKSVGLAKERYDAEVYACVTDNARNMTSMGTQIGILFTTCNAHTGNLLAGDILKSAKYVKVMAKVLVVQKDFRRPPLESRLLIAGGKKAVLSCVTRWASQRGAGVSFLKNLPFMKKVAAECDAEYENDQNAIRPKPDVSHLLFNADFVESVKELVDMLDPVAELINYCQRSDVSVADAVEKWLDLFRNESHNLHKYVEERCSKSNVFNNVTMAANSLHPVYRGQKLSECQQIVVNDYVLEHLDADALESLRFFTSSQGKFAVLFKKNIRSPKTFWHFARQQGHKQLADFATKFLSIPASTAQLERMFSNWADIHTDTRNRLSTETSKKLVNIYFTLRANDDPIDEIDDDDGEVDE